MVNINSIVGSGAALVGASGIAGLCAYQGARLCIHVANKIKNNAISPEAASTAKKIAFTIGATAVFSIGAPIAIYYSKNTFETMVMQSVAFPEKQPGEAMKMAFLYGELSLRMFIAIARNSLGMESFQSILDSTKV